MPPKHLLRAHRYSARVYPQKSAGHFKRFWLGGFLLTGAAQIDGRIDQPDQSFA
jgi:hypothetical protein